MISLVIRADADTRIGSGHLLRCLALAQACADRGGKVTFACARIEPASRQRLLEEGFAVHSIAGEPGGQEDAAQVVGVAGHCGAEWVVVDGYAFGSEYQRHIKNGGSKLLVVDDYGQADHYYADVVLNPNSSADAALYTNRDERTRLLLGLRYALLRREFRTWGGPKREIPAVARNLLVTLGGGAYGDLLLRIVRAIEQAGFSDLKVRILAAASDVNSPTLIDAARKCPTPVEVLPLSPNMPELLAWADIAIGAAGSNTWERAFLGLPSLVIVLADNQRENALFCERRGIGVNLGDAGTVRVEELARTLADLVPDQARRAEMSRRGGDLVDALGPGRVLDALEDDGVGLRDLRADDCRRVWEWANDPGVRAVSFRGDPIPWEGHQRWFAAKLGDPDCLFFIATGDGGEPIGQVYFDVKGREAVVSVSLAPASRGKGYGPRVIRKASRKLLDRGAVESIHAYIKPNNEASLRAFGRAGYVAAEPTRIHGHPAEHMIFQR